MSRWFRLYDRVLDDPKVQRLAPDLFKGWVNLLCLAARHDGNLPSLADIAFALRITDREADSLVTSLMAAGLLDDRDDGLRPHKWDDLQFVSDRDKSNAERQRRWREKQRNKAVTESHNVTQRLPDTDTETDSTFTSVNEPAAVEPPTARQRLWSEGIATLQTMGVKPQQARAIVGKWLKDTNDDIDRILGAIQRAREDQVVNPIPWITAGLTQPKAKRDARTDRNTQWLATLSGDAEQTDFIDGDFEVVGTDDRLRLAPRRD